MSDTTAGEAGPKLNLPPGMQMPQGIKVRQPTPPFPPDLTVRLERARQSRRYMVAVWEVEPVDGAVPTIHLHWSREGFEYDCLLRAFAMFRDQVLTCPLPATLEARPEAAAAPTTPPDTAAK